jgi:hypothetical protein
MKIRVSQLLLALVIDAATMRASCTHPMSSCVPGTNLLRAQDGVKEAHDKGVLPIYSRLFFDLR